MSRPTTDTRAQMERCGHSQALNLGPFVLRVAGWPIETLDQLRSPLLTEGVDRWLEREETVRMDSRRLADSLHALVPVIRDGALRSVVLSLRRRIHRSADPLPESLTQPVLTSKSVPPAVKKSIRRQSEARAGHAAERRELELTYES